MQTKILDRILAPVPMRIAMVVIAAGVVVVGRYVPAVGQFFELLYR